MEQWNSDGGTVWWNSGKVEQPWWNSEVEKWNSHGGTVWWNSKTVMVETVWWHSGTLMVEQCAETVEQ